MWSYSPLSTSSHICGLQHSRITSPSDTPRTLSFSYTCTHEPYRENTLSIRTADSCRFTHAMNRLGRRGGKAAALDPPPGPPDGPVFNRVSWVLLLLLAVGFSSACRPLRESRIPERMAMPMVPQPRTVSASGCCGVEGEDIDVGMWRVQQRVDIQ